MSAHIGPGLDIITEERVRQVLEKGYTREHDAQQHPNGEIAAAAAVYAAYDVAGPITRGDVYRKLWPFEHAAWKPGHPDDLDDRVRRLAKAGAMMAAEIDRLLFEADS